MPTKKTTRRNNSKGSSTTNTNTTKGVSPHTNTRKTTPKTNTGNNNSNSLRRDWKYVPPWKAVNSDVVSSVACNGGLPMGKCLQDSLDELLLQVTMQHETSKSTTTTTTEDYHNDNDNNNNNNAIPIMINREHTNKILDAFGSAVANTPSWKTKGKRTRTTYNNKDQIYDNDTDEDGVTNVDEGGEKDDDDDDSSSPAHPHQHRRPPSALITGRLDHYNRVGQNWKIVVDNVTIQERREDLSTTTLPLSLSSSHSTTGSGRSRSSNRKRERESLFHDVNHHISNDDDDATTTTTTTTSKIPIDGILHIHAYDDV